MSGRRTRGPVRFVSSRQADDELAVWIIEPSDPESGSSGRVQISGAMLADLAWVASRWFELHPNWFTATTNISARHADAVSTVNELLAELGIDPTKPRPPTPAEQRSERWRVRG